MFEAEFGRSTIGRAWGSGQLPVAQPYYAAVWRTRSPVFFVIVSKNMGQSMALRREGATKELARRIGSPSSHYRELRVVRKPDTTRQ
jgi:hypothetical protein